MEITLDPSDPSDKDDPELPDDRDPDEPDELEDLDEPLLRLLLELDELLTPEPLLDEDEPELFADPLVKLELLSKLERLDADVLDSDDPADPDDALLGTSLGRLGNVGTSVPRNGIPTCGSGIWGATCHNR